MSNLNFKLQLQSATSNLNLKFWLQAPARAELGPAQPQLVIVFNESFSAILDHIGLFLGLGKGSKTVLRSTHVFEQLSFSMLPSILTFDLT